MSRKPAPWIAANANALDQHAERRDNDQERYHVLPFGRRAGRKSGLATAVHLIDCPVRVR